MFGISPIFTMSAGGTGGFNINQTAYDNALASVRTMVFEITGNDKAMTVLPATAFSELMSSGDLPTFITRLSSYTGVEPESIKARQLKTLEDAARFLADPK